MVSYFWVLTGQRTGVFEIIYIRKFLRNSSVPREWQSFWTQRRQGGVPRNAVLLHFGAYGTTVHTFKIITRRTYKFSFLIYIYTVFIYFPCHSVGSFFSFLIFQFPNRGSRQLVALSKIYDKIIFLSHYQNDCQIASSQHAHTRNFEHTPCVGPHYTRTVLAATVYLNKFHF